MAQIAEDLFLLLLDNASAQPGLDQPRRDRVLTGAVLLDLAYACRIRPTVPGEEIEAGLLVALAGDWAPDPVADPAFQLLSRHPLRPDAAMSKLRRHTQENLVAHLEQTGQIRRIQLLSKRKNPPTAWPVANRERVGHARAQLLSALFDRRPPAPQTAAIITLLHAVDGLGALLSLNDRGWRWVHARAGEIALGSWLEESSASNSVPEMNLAVTASALRPALA